jgi:aspartyl/asparaginyl-tRNA synthetase
MRSKRIWSETGGQHEGQTITLRGWLYNLRESGKLLFPIFRDGTGTIQGIVPKGRRLPKRSSRPQGLTLESSVIVTGKVRADKRAPGGFELDVEDVKSSSASPRRPYPITLKEHGVDFLMEHRHLWVRTPRQSAILRVRATIMRAAAEYFDTNGFIRTDPPILTPAPAKAPRRSSRWTTSATTRPTSPSPASSTSKPRRWRSARSTASAPPSARKNPRPAATSPSSG